MARMEQRGARLGCPIDWTDWYTRNIPLADDIIDAAHLDSLPEDTA